MPEPSRPPLLVVSRRAWLAAFALAVAAFLGAWAVLVATLAYHPGFDDGEHLRAALLWAGEGRLDAQGIFVRVPLFAVLLGTLFHALEPLKALFAFQLAVVAAALALFFRHARLAAGPAGATPASLATVLLLAWSPLVLLYTRHAVNELFIGLLAMGVLTLGLHPVRGRAVWLGLLCGAAGMTKLMALALVAPALIFLLRGLPGRRAAGEAARFAAGLAAVVVPLVTLHLVQRPGLPLDTTSAFNLSGYDANEWVALGGPLERYHAGLAHWRESLTGDPLGYAAGVGRRLARWTLRPATADFAYYYPDFPTGPVGIWEQVSLAALLLLAAVGTTRASAPIWLFHAAVLASSVLPMHVPFTPKVMLVFPSLLLAPAGVDRLLGRGPVPR